MSTRHALVVALFIVTLAQGQTTRPALTPSDAWNPDRPARAAIFRAAGFPTADAPAIPDSVLDEALRGLPVDVLASEDAIETKLKLRDYDVLVLPYGSAFPVGAWPAILGYLQRGGGLVVFGGAPFHQPVRWDGAKWVLGPRQPSYAHELLIGPAEAIAIGEGEVIPKVRWRFGFPKPARVFALTVRFTTKKDFEKEDGTSGPRDAILSPLVQVVRDEMPIACPLLEIDRLRGSDAGARWVLAPSDATLSAELVRWCIERGMEGARVLDARPIHALVRSDEPAVIRMTLRQPKLRTSDRAGMRETLGEFSHTASECVTVEARKAPASRPGLHRWSDDAKSVLDLFDVGWVVRDDALLASGPKLSVSRDWLRKDGKVFPIVGTTYMASDVHRKFLFEPNPAVWDQDFAAMKKMGVNFVRTGLWNSWSRVMLDSGAVDEGVLRALEAYVQVAASHGIVVCFNFFAFQPPMFGGVNPFLDPRALEGQKALLVAVASRFKGCNWVHWDLINEPSYCPPDKLWTNQPIGDEFEKRAWHDWVVANVGSDPLVLRDRWRDASSDVMSIPKADELAWSMIREHRRPRKALDFVRFTNDVVAKWAADLRATLRAASGDALVTLGQDEGGTHVRPAHQLHAQSVDYTAVHTWWNNDDLLWDGVMTKVPEKPSLIQETGLMRLEDLDGMPWRSPEDAAKLLERKFAYAFMGRGCGAVEWAWNVNPYMPIDNESVIGLVRPDGTYKPEAFVLRDFGAFFEEAAPRLDDFAPDEVVVVIPHARMFARGRNLPDPTKTLVRAFAEHLGVVPTAISGLQVTAERLAGAKLVLVPQPELIDDATLATLRAASERGVKVLLTGALANGRAVMLREPTAWGASPPGEPAWVTFDGGQNEWLSREDVPGLTKLEGNWWHEPLPLELARETRPLLALLAAAAEAAGVATNPSDAPVAARVLLAPAVALVVVANETGVAHRRRVAVDGGGFEVPVEAGRARLALIERKTGEVLAATPGAAVSRLK